MAAKPVAGFLVMGKTGYVGLKRAFMDSISDYVVGHAAELEDLVHALLERRLDLGVVHRRLKG